jgi:GNAT superfamily N-acetyltransferase
VNAAPQIATEDATAREPRVRLAEAGDVAFIASTWKQSYWRESPWASRLRWRTFEPQHGQVVQRLLARSSALVACDPERPADIVGYLVFELPAPAALHFAYVKPAFRRAGVLRALLAASALPADLAGVRVTHATWAWFSRTGKPGLEERYPAAVNNPSWAYEGST